MTDYKCLIAKLAGRGLPSQVVVSVTRSRSQSPLRARGTYWVLTSRLGGGKSRAGRVCGLSTFKFKSLAACRPPLSRELLDSVAHPSRGWRRCAWVQVRSCARPVPVAARRLGQCLRARRAAYSMTCIRWLRSPGLRVGARMLANLKSHRRGRRRPESGPGRPKPGPPHGVTVSSTSQSPDRALTSTGPAGAARQGGM